jgi:tRNA(Arg) A34 adenosine deaminase TadA
VQERWLRRAIEIAQENVRAGTGGPFGAVIVRGNELIAEGANAVTSTNDPTAHAEVNAIRRAAAALGRFDLAGCEIYSSCEPCPMCLGAIYWARLDAVWYAATRHDAARAGFSDERIYRAFAGEAVEGKIPVQRVRLADGLDPFRDWDDKPDKIRY